MIITIFTIRFFVIIQFSWILGVIFMEGGFGRVGSSFDGKCLRIFDGLSVVKVVLKQFMLITIDFL